MLDSDLLLRDYLYELWKKNSFEERFNVYDKYVKKLDFEAVTYSLMPRIQYESCFKYTPTFQSSNSFSSDFLAHYTTENLSQNDFTIRRISHNCLDLMDWRQYERDKLISVKEAKLIELAREDYGILNALSIPTMNAEAGFSGASIVSSEKDASFQKLKKEKMGALVFITRCFHESNFHSARLPHKFIDHFIDFLTPNEIGILHHLSSGKSFQKIEDSIQVASYKVASQALSNLRIKKFNHITKERLLYLFGKIESSLFIKL